MSDSAFIPTEVRVPVVEGRLECQVIDITAAWLRPAPVVIFQHGIGTDMGIWSEWLPALASQYRLVRFSMRGFGNSSLPGDCFDWTLERFSEDLLAVADAAGASRFHLIAESFGGTIALHTALRHPQRVESLGLMSTPHCGAAVLPVQQWPDYAMTCAGMAQWSAEMMVGRFTEGAVNPRALAWFQQTQERTTPAVLRHLAGLVATTDLRPRLAQLQTPALLMSGDDSPYVGIEQVAALHKLLPHSQVKIIPNARHGIAFSHARECARSFFAFAAGLRGPQPVPKELL